ncbi:MAG: pyruvate formate lyase family protein, partial [Candidatus Thorarchaeota archaeon]
MTSRSKRLKQRMLDSEPTISSERAELFTDYVKEHLSESVMLRLAGAFAHVLDNVTIRIEPEELIVGNMGPTPRSCQVFPEYSWKWIEEELERFDKRRTERFSISDEDKKKLREVFKFWDGKSTAEIAGTMMPEESIYASKAGLFTIGAPGTGIGHVIVNYKNVLKKGFLRILDEIEGKEGDYYYAVRAEIIAVLRFAERFSQLASELAKKETDEQRKGELLEIARICKKVPAEPAGS